MAPRRFWTITSEQVGNKEGKRITNAVKRQILQNDNLHRVIRASLSSGYKQALAFVYCENEPGRRAAAKLLTRDEARRIAANTL